MALVPNTKDEKRRIQRGERTSTYENKADVPSWGHSGQVCSFFNVMNDVDSATFEMRTATYGTWSTEISVRVQVGLSLNELEQFIAELGVIRDSMREQVQHKQS